MSDEIDPYIVYRIVNGMVDCALWQIKEGPQALALFLSGDSALEYQKASMLDAAFRIIRPSRAALLEILSAAFQAGIRHAVLDPNQEMTKRIFDLQQILAAATS